MDNLRHIWDQTHAENMRVNPQIAENIRRANVNAGRMFDCHRVLGLASKKLGLGLTETQIEQVLDEFREIVKAETY